MTENHFFSLSCLLFPHVRATPDYIENPYFDRGWPQNLYLEPSSPLVKSIRFPPGFDIEKTPLVTFRRVDLLFEQPQLDALYHSLHPDSPYVSANESIFSDEAAWNLSPEEYVKIFTSPLPQGNYATMVVSTGGHWTTTLFSGLKDTSMFKDGIENVLGFFSEAMEAWAREVQALLDDAEEAEWANRRFSIGRSRGRKMAPRQVVARAYLPGHEDCHDHRDPWTSYKPGRWGWYNWNQIGDFNDAFEVRVRCSPVCFLTVLISSHRPYWTRASTQIYTSSLLTGQHSSDPTLIRRATACILCRALACSRGGRSTSGITSPSSFLAAFGNSRVGPACWPLGTAWGTTDASLCLCHASFGTSFRTSRISFIPHTLHLDHTHSTLHSHIPTSTSITVTTLAYTISSGHLSSRSFLE